MALNVELHLISESGKRQIPIEKFITGYRKTALKKQEIIHSVFIPVPNDSIVKFYKVSKRKDLDISTLSGGFRIKIEKGYISEMCLAFGGMAETPKRAFKTESYLVGKRWNIEVVNEAQKILMNEFNPISDARSGSNFRKLVAKNLLLKFYNETSNE